MKGIKQIVLLLSLAIALPGYSQQQEYNLNAMDVYMMKDAKYQGKKYLYYNMIRYDGVSFKPPMPFQGERIRDGKYEASATALNDYIEEFKKKNSGKVFTFVKCFKDPNPLRISGAVLANETGDTVFVPLGKNLEEFFSVDYLETEKKNIGKTLYEKSPGALPLDQINCPRFYSYSDFKTKELKPSYLPFMSEWIIKDVNYDTIQCPGRISCGFNHYRLYYVIENKKYGSLICFFNENKHTFSKEEALEFTRGKSFSHFNFGYSTEDLKIFEKWANEGTPDMKFFYFLVAEKESKSKEEVSEEIVRLAEEGSLAAAIELEYQFDFLREFPDKLAAITKKICQPVEESRLYADMYMRAGHCLYYSIIDYKKKEKNELDKILSLAEEMYSLAEKCGADSRELSDAMEELRTLKGEINQEFSSVAN